MNKKNSIGSILIVLMFLLIATTSMINAKTTQKKENTKESPLFKIRTQGVLNKIKEKIREKYLEDRIFIVPRLNFLKYREENDDSLITRGVTCRFTECYGTVLFTCCGPKCTRIIN